MRAKRSHWYVVHGTNNQLTRVPRKLVARLLWRWRNTRAIPRLRGPSGSRSLNLASVAWPVAMAEKGWAFHFFWRFERGRAWVLFADYPSEHLILVKIKQTKAARLAAYHESKAAARAAVAHARMMRRKTTV